VSPAILIDAVILLDPARLMTGVFPLEGCTWKGVGEGLELGHQREGRRDAGRSGGADGEEGARPLSP
jgi:hypothetical protein